MAKKEKSIDGEGKRRPSSKKRKMKQICRGACDWGFSMVTFNIIREISAEMNERILVKIKALWEYNGRAMCERVKEVIIRSPLRRVCRDTEIPSSSVDLKTRQRKDVEIRRASVRV